MFGKSLIPVVVGGKEELNLERVTVGEPGEGNKPFYSHNVASLETVEDAVRIAKFEQKKLVLKQKPTKKFMRYLAMLQKIWRTIEQELLQQ